MVATALRAVQHLIHDKSVVVRSGMEDMSEYELALHVPVEVKVQGWARRPSHGEQYGVTYIGRYAAEIMEMFQRGVAESTNKMSPAAMLEMLERRFPGRYSLPGENEIRVLIQAHG